MLLRISHKTTYSYDAPTPYGLQQVRLTPTSRRGQQVKQWAVTVAGGLKEAEFTDEHDNAVTLISMLPETLEIEVSCAGIVETRDCAGVFGVHDGRAPLWYYLRSTPRTEAGPLVTELIAEFSSAPRNDVAVLHGLSQRILESASYRIGATQSMTTAEEALKIGSGVCQDHAHIFAAAVRALGHPARYVSGYLLMDGRDAQEAGHAWAEAHVDGLGWVGFDVSNQMCPDERYVAIATGLDAIEAAPVRGLMLERGEGQLNVSVEVQQQ